jgi:LysM repeat protein
LKQPLLGEHDLKQCIRMKLGLVFLLCGSLAQAQTLMGSAASMEKQYQLARTYGFNFINTASEVQRNVNSNQLVRVNPDRYMELHDVSYPYAVSETKLFLARISAQYYSACGEKLTVTSLLRPRNRQPANASARSVHPTGMAADLRIPAKANCRAWLERTLLSLEKERVLDVTREHYPPHYHVAVYAKQYETRVAAVYGSNFGQPVTEFSAQPERDMAVETQPIAQPVAQRPATARSYVVRKGDSLSTIADRTGVSVRQLRAANGLRGNLINAGQKLRIPTTAPTHVASSAGKNTVVAVNEIKHRVNRGDTLWRIANRYGTSVQKLRQSNSNAGDSLQVGQVIKISRG